MGAISVKFHTEIDQFLTGYTKNKANVLTKIGKIGVANIKSETPVLTGRLQSGNDYNVDKDTVNFINDTPYASYVERGTWKQSANPYMRRGFNKSLPAFRSILLNGLAPSNKNYNVTIDSFDI